MYRKFFTTISWLHHASVSYCEINFERRTTAWGNLKFDCATEWMTRDIFRCFKIAVRSEIVTNTNVVAERSGWSYVLRINTMWSNPVAAALFNRSTKWIWKPTASQPLIVKRSSVNSSKKWRRWKIIMNANEGSSIGCHKGWMRFGFEPILNQLKKIPSYQYSEHGYWWYLNGYLLSICSSGFGRCLKTIGANEFDAHQQST